MGAGWTAYEVFSVISGVIFVIAAVTPLTEGTERLWALLAGAFFIGYGIYVAQQTSGTWEFSIIIFIVPPLAFLWLIWKVIEIVVGSRQTGEDPSAPSPGQGWAPEDAAAAPIVNTAYAQEAVGGPALGATGAERTGGKFCLSCGAATPETGRFCMSCGAALQRT